MLFETSTDEERRAAWEQQYGIVVGVAAELPPAFKIGYSANLLEGSGCTVLLCEEGAVAGVAVLGAAPATRETDLLRTENTVERINGLVLSGGSAFGLDAASGVMRYLAQNNAGITFGVSTIPIVVGAALYDLEVSKGKVTPTSMMGYSAAHSNSRTIEVGNAGVGAGASVGKLLGMEYCMKSGIGAASITKDDLVITALVAVNALGCVYDRSIGAYVAGVIDPDTMYMGKRKILDPYRALEMPVDTAMPTESNTTIGCILTNAVITKAQANRIALMGHDGYARAIEPVHSSFDGDAVFCMSECKVDANPDIIGALAALVMERAVVNAVVDTESAYGFIAASSL